MYPIKLGLVNKTYFTIQLLNRSFAVMRKAQVAISTTVDTVTNSESEAKTHVTDDGIEYTPHSMIHKAIVRMDPTKLEMLDDFERTDSGHKFTPKDSNVRVMVTGRDWSKKRILIYGSTSTEEAEQYVETIVNRINGVDHEAEIVDRPVITNIAVNGDFNTAIQLEAFVTGLAEQKIDVEYEPEQFPGAILKLSEPPITFLLFSTGRFVIQGLRDFEDIQPAIKQVQSLLN